ncbi:MAG: metallophosphoesterase, partial [Methanomicrobiales archaeon]|nr:metallophosphoesterase [Methanomicrobiales archaeon]
MIPFHRFLLLLLALAALALPVMAASGDPVIIEPAVLLRGPYLTPAPGGITVNLRFDRPMGVTVVYRPAEKENQDAASEQSVASPAATDHRVVLPDLLPGTGYRYRVIYGNGTTGDLSFLTCPSTGEPLSFLVMGDTRDEPPLILQEERFGAVAARAADEPGVTFVVHTGDFVLDGDREEDWDRFFRTGGILLTNTTILPVRGNHDGSPDRFREVLGLPANYTFTCGDVTLAVLDSGDESWGDLPAQARWLEGELATGGPFRFGATHYPLYSSEEKHFGGWENLRETFAPIFSRQGVLAVFQGHVHLYERDSAGGVQYVTEGRGGAPSYWLGEYTIPEHRRSLIGTMGYTRVTVRSPSIPAEMEVIRVADIREGRVITLPQGATVERIDLEVGKPRLFRQDGTGISGLLP